MQNILGDITPEVFLRDYWQKKPLLIRNAIPNIQCPISPEEMAGLACEEEVESRIVIENLKGKPWQVKNGPFTEKDFRKSPNSPWTLLIQGIDHWVPELSELLDRFRFIPNWRLDDIMASYAPPGGSVGPHFDYYDVFLLQAQGSRRWKIGPFCSAKSPRLQGTPLRILENFETSTEWLLEPGDMLYLPPQVAHYGIAEEDCITLSIGFRSPTEDELLSSFTDHLMEFHGPEVHMDDPTLALQSNPGEIQLDVLQKVRNILLAKIDQPETMAQWFGEFVTSPKSDQLLFPPDEPISAKKVTRKLIQGEALKWNEGSRFAYFKSADQYITLFCDGHAFRRSPGESEFLQTLCEKSLINVSKLAQHLADLPEITELLVQLINQGSLYFPEL